jgi:hypothetical protein
MTKNTVTTSVTTRLAHSLPLVAATLHGHHALHSDRVGPE